MPEVIIIGGGFSGLCMAIQLKRQLGMQDFLLFERGSTLGGVWANHKYPGVKCDVPTALYSFSFGRRYWKDLFSNGDAIQNYLQDLAQEYHILESNTYLSSEVIEAVWSEAHKHWKVQVLDKSSSGLDTVTSYTCKILLSAVGNMSVPNGLNIDGQQTFTGRIVHSGQYPDSLNLKDKHVVLVGNGCSATQIAGAIAPHVRHLSIFAPSKHWILPRPTIPVPWVFDFLTKYTTFGKLLLRFSIFIVGEHGLRAMNWSGGKSQRDRTEKVARAYVWEKAPAAYRDQLIPNFAYGTKRPVFDVDYLQTLHRHNVTLYFEAIKSLAQTSVICQTGVAIKADIIIAAIGFKSQHFLHSLKVIGQEGLDLQTHMTRHGGLYCYKGSFFSKFPNFATIYGPNTGTAFGSVVFMIECQVAMVMKRLVVPVLQEEDVDSVVVKDEKEVEWMQWLRKELRNTVWEHENKGWYNDINGLCTANYPKSLLHFWFTTAMTSGRDFIHDPRDYTKGTYGSIKEFETFAAIIVVFLLVAFLSLTIS